MVSLINWVAKIYASPKNANLIDGRERSQKGITLGVRTSGRASKVMGMGGWVAQEEIWWDSSFDSSVTSRPVLDFGLDLDLAQQIAWQYLDKKIVLSNLNPHYQPFLELIESVSSILQQVMEVQLSCCNELQSDNEHLENMFLVTLHRSVHDDMSSRLGLIETGNSGWMVTLEKPWE